MLIIQRRSIGSSCKSKNLFQVLSYLSHESRIQGELVDIERSDADSFTSLSSRWMEIGSSCKISRCDKANGSARGDALMALRQRMADRTIVIYTRIMVGCYLAVRAII